MKFSIAAAAAALTCFFGSASSAAILFSDNFDVDSTANWTTNSNAFGTNAANYYFDYSTAGIPAAPGSGGTTRGLKIGANLNSATAPGTSAQIPGIAVSPTGKEFSGDYELKFQSWSNYIGPLHEGATGSTMLSTYGIMTGGAAAQGPGVSDSISFATTGDGQAAADYRAYSKERPAGYAVYAAGGNALDQHIVFAAGSQNSSNAFYGTMFPAGTTAPAVQGATQTNATSSGAAGFRWNAVSIKKAGDIVTWTVNGTLLATLDSSTFASTITGKNIFFGMSDTNNTTNSNATNLQNLQFTLIDNVQVIGVPEPSAMALAALCGLGLAAVRGRRAA